MKYTYATLLLQDTGAEINEQNLTDVLAAADADVSVSRVKAVVAALEGVGLDEYAATPPTGAADGVDEDGQDTTPTPADASQRTGDGADSTPDGSVHQDGSPGGGRVDEEPNPELPEPAARDEQGEP